MKNYENQPHDQPGSRRDFLTQTGILVASGLAATGIISCASEKGGDEDVTTNEDLMREHGIPSLAVHDSLIVPRSATNIAVTALRNRFRSTTQREVQLTVHAEGLTVS